MGEIVLDIFRICLYHAISFAIVDIESLGPTEVVRYYTEQCNSLSAWTPCESIGSMNQLVVCDDEDACYYVKLNHKENNHGNNHRSIKRYIYT